MTPSSTSSTTLGTYYAAFNVTSKIFDGKTVEQANAMREAFSMLIDRQYIIDTVGQTEPEDRYQLHSRRHGGRPRRRVQAERRRSTPIPWATAIMPRMWTWKVLSSC